jgi:hypothetical protein
MEPSGEHLKSQRKDMLSSSAGGKRGDGSVMTTAALEVIFDDYFASSGSVFMKLLGLRPH